MFQLCFQVGGLARFQMLAAFHGEALEAGNPGADPVVTPCSWVPGA